MLEVSGLTVRYGDVVALDGLDLAVGEDEIVAVLGPSGSGKSTLLRVIAGLDAPERGTVRWEGVDVTDQPAHLRRFGLMFQDFALFPHLDVAGNVAFGLRMQDVPPPQARARVDEVLELVGLAGYGERRITELSGGEAQRVALARALAPEPRLLMLDEPLGSLDRPLRERLVVEIGDVLGELGIGALYVTHDHDEAFAVGDRLAVLDAGRLVQEGPPEDVWRRPADEFVARFLGFDNVADGRVAGRAADTPWGRVPVPDGSPEGPARLVVRPDAFHLDPTGPVEGVVTARQFRGDHFALVVTGEHGPPLEVLLRERVGVGERVRLAVDPDGVVIL